MAKDKYNRGNNTAEGNPLAKKAPFTEPEKNELQPETPDAFSKASDPQDYFVSGGDMKSAAGEEESEDHVSIKDTAEKKKFTWNIYTVIRILCFIGFLIFTALLINEVAIQPYRIRKSIELTRELYNKPTDAPSVIATPVPTPATAGASVGTQSDPASKAPDPNRDEQGRLLQFKDLLATNQDVKGWLTIEKTNIDYVVMQSHRKDAPNYYLDKDINGDYSKAGTLYLDPNSSVENRTKNLVIHGHNMVSTAEKMFHFLLKYKKTDYYSKHPTITFDTIYNTGKWKIFAVFITNGSDKKEPLFDYRKSTFKDSFEFLNFVYQLRIRSLLSIDSVDVNENDELLTLSTCSYELDNYRFVVVARKVRAGEDPEVDVTTVTKNPDPLYPESYYDHYGGEAPKISDTFEEALKNKEINWYTKPE